MQTTIFVLLYLALDGISFIHPLHGLNITPWNPAPALGMVFLVRYQRAAWGPLVLAILASEALIRGLPNLWWTSLVASLVLAGGYIALGAALERHLSPTQLLDDKRTLFSWLVLVAVGTLMVSYIYLFVLRLLGLLPNAGWWQALGRFWMGDCVGITVMMPLFWWLSSERGRFLLRRALQPESAGYAALAIMSLWVAFGFGEQHGFKLFFLLFMPIIWAATRQGMGGAILCAALLQVGVIGAIRLFQYQDAPLTELQILALAMAMVGFIVGVVVDEQHRTNEKLRQSLHLAAAGEMAGALAHELNQPLTALTAYAGACEQLLARGNTGEQLLAAIHCVQRESQRAADVVRRLRDFFRTGETQLESIFLPQLMGSVIGLFNEKAEQHGIRLKLHPVPEVYLLADKLQLEVVLRNLLSNAFDAVLSSPRHQRRISVSAWEEADEQVCLCVEDSGLGLTSEKAASLFEPFQSTKTSGLGLGLVISRAIIETHGGELWGEVASHGVFKLVLPIETAEQEQAAASTQAHPG
jgi:signal transduction histidine kinase